MTFNINDLLDTDGNLITQVAIPPEEIDNFVKYMEACSLLYDGIFSPPAVSTTSQALVLMKALGITFLINLTEDLVNSCPSEETASSGLNLLEDFLNEHHELGDKLIAEARTYIATKDWNKSK